jgi:hypothetical protein
MCPHSLRPSLCVPSLPPSLYVPSLPPFLFPECLRRWKVRLIRTGKSEIKRDIFSTMMARNPYVCTSGIDGRQSSSNSLIPNCIISSLEPENCDDRQLAWRHFSELLFWLISYWFSISVPEKRTYIRQLVFLRCNCDLLLKLRIVGVRILDHGSSRPDVDCYDNIMYSVYVFL